MTLALYFELSHLIEYMSEREFAKAYTDTHKRTWRNSWHLGAAHKIAGRFYRQMQETKTESSGNSTALMVIGNRTNEVIAKVYPKLHNVQRSSSALDSTAYNAGREAAANMSLDRTAKLG